MVDFGNCDRCGKPSSAQRYELDPTEEEGFLVCEECFLEWQKIYRLEFEKWTLAGKAPAAKLPEAVETGLKILGPLMHDLALHVVDKAMLIRLARKIDILVASVAVEALSKPESERLKTIELYSAEIAKKLEADSA